MGSDSDEVETPAVDGDEQREGNSRGRRRAVVLVLVLAVLGVAAAGGTVWWRERDRVDEGVVREHVEVYENESYDAEVRLPGGRTLVLRVAVGYEQDEYGWDGPVRPPRDGRFVEVSWSESTVYPVLQPSVPMTRAPAELTLRTAGRSFALGASPPAGAGSGGQRPRTPQRSAVVALEGESSQPSVDVAFLGRRQSVEVGTGTRVMGSFAGLYDARMSHRESWLATSKDEVAGDLRAYHGVDLATTRQPYVQGLGWARPGREWLVLGQAGLRASSVSSADNQARLEHNPTEAVQGSMTVDGRPPVRRLSKDRVTRESGDTTWFHPADAVYDVPAAGEVTVRLEMSFLVEAENAESRPYDGRRLRVSDVVRVPASVMGGAQ